MHSKLRLPENINKVSLLALYRKMKTESDRKVKIDRQEYLRRSRLLHQTAKEIGSVLNIDKKSVPARFKTFQESFDKLRTRRRPKIRPLSGHNPVRYYPFDWPYASVSASGIGSLSTYGPDARFGEAGANLREAIGGHENAVTGVGFYYLAQQSGTLLINCQILFDGEARVGTFLGYSNASVAVQLDVAQYSPWQLWSSQQTIWDRSAYVFLGDAQSWSWQFTNVSIAVPIVAGGIYAISCNMRQDVYVGGLGAAVSDVACFIGPFTYTFV